MAGAALLPLALLASLGLGLGLHWLVRAEAADREVMSREAAERTVRRDPVDDEREP